MLFFCENTRHIRREAIGFWKLWDAENMMLSACNTIIINTTYIEIILNTNVRNVYVLRSDYYKGDI